MGEFQLKHKILESLDEIIIKAGEYQKNDDSSVTVDVILIKH
jgi:hypothetical protein